MNEKLMASNMTIGRDRLMRFGIRLTHLSRLLGVLMVTLLVSACSNPKHVVVFVDLSGSTKTSWSSFEEDLDEVQSKLNPGDKFLVATITGASYTKFEPVVNQTLPDFKFWKDNTRQYDQDLAEARKLIRERLAAFFDVASPSTKTDILNAFVLAKKIYTDSDYRLVLVIMSDMIEDSERYNFDRMSFDDQLIESIISDQRSQGLLPDLKGVEVIVIGASANSAAKAHGIERFWKTYIQAMSGKIEDGRYSSTLLEFPE